MSKPMRLLTLLLAGAAITACSKVQTEEVGTIVEQAEAVGKTETASQGKVVIDPNNGVATVSVADIDLSYRMHGGIAITYDGIPISAGTDLWVVTPDWGDRYYGVPDNSLLMKNMEVEDYKGGKRLIVNHTMPAGEYDTGFDGTETITVLPDNSVTITLDFIFTKEEPAIFEWSVGKLHTMPIIGLPYKATYYDGSVDSGAVPYEAAEADIVKSSIARNFKTVEIDTHFGPLEIEASENNNLMITDYRKNRHAIKSLPIFWFGTYEGSITPHERVTKRVTFRFPENPEDRVKVGDDVSGSAKVQPVSDARIVDASEKPVIPTPKEMKSTGARMPLSNATAIYVGENPTEGTEKALGFLLKDMKDFYDLEPRIVRGPLPANRPAGGIYLGVADRFSTPADQCDAAGLGIPEHNEGYALLVDKDGAYIAANSGQGVFHGVTTLVQRFGVMPEGVFFHGTEIRDWPSLDFRGVHALSGKKAGDQIARALRNLMARYKMNYFVWECQYIIWDAAPELEHPQYGMTKAEAKKVVEAADENMIEIIPLVQSLGHSEWIFTNDQNEALAEDPGYLYAYNVSNPDTYEFIYKVYQEAVDFFKPRYFHIGHDEVRMRGRYPYRSADMGDAVDLFLYDTMRHYEWFKERGMDIMIWGDMALHPSEASDAHHAKSMDEARRLRDGLPKDIIIADWHYAPVEPEEYISIPLWIEEGFTVLGCGWYNPVNIANLAKACVNNDAWGYMQTTWAGFNFRILGNEGAWFQYWVYPLAAHYAWTGENTPESDLPFGVKQLFLDSYFPSKPLLKNQSGYLVDLSSVVNRSLADNENHEGWLGFGPDRDFSALPVGNHTFGQTQFHVGKDVLMLAGRFNPEGAYPAKATIKLPEVKGSQIHLLMNAASRAPEDTKAGELIVTYADGTRSAFDLVYGENLFMPSDERVGDRARLAWEGKMKSDESIRVWDVSFDLSADQKPISSITITSTNTTAAPIIFAVTVVE